MPLEYKKVVVFGATSGIGLALAERLIAGGVFVIGIGRRKANLDALVQKHGQDKVQGLEFDITQLDEIPSLAQTVMKAHADVDCLVLNAGIQRRCDFSQPDQVDMDLVHTEFVTNYLAQLALTKAFLPYLQRKQEKSALVFVSQLLGTRA